MPVLFKHKSAFTFIELLLAIAILAIITGVISSAMLGRQKQARDTKRKSDLAQIKKALESAKIDCQGGSFYPVPYPNNNERDRYNIPNTPPDGIGLNDHLKHSNLKYTKADLKDPLNSSSSNFQYRYAAKTFLQLTQDVCPSTTLAKTVEGSPDFVLRTALEMSNDPDLKKSWLKCENKISVTQMAFTFPAPVDSDDNDIDDNNFYYECNT